MSKQQQLSPEKYILTRARTLPIHKCYVTADWENSSMANVIVMRRHVNGNYTVGLYLVDLLCLGIKDTFYMFNVSEEEINERIDIDAMFLKEAEYNLVHNIVYAGYDYAMEYDIKPVKDFNVTKFILEEDDDNIPLIEIPVGDENGQPHLLVSESYNYGPILKKLQQNAGEGNYTFTIGDDFEEDDDIEDEFDEDEFDGDDEDFDYDEEEFVDFNIVAPMEDEELEDFMEEISMGTNGFIINAELLFRQLNEREGGIITGIEQLMETKEYKLYQNKLKDWQTTEDKPEGQFEDLFLEIHSLIQVDENSNEEVIFAGFLNLLDKHKANDEMAFIILGSIPLLTMVMQMEKLEDKFTQYPPAVQLLITAFAVLLNKTENTDFDFILNASTVEMAYPFNRSIHSLHHKLFWLIKALLAIQQNDKENILRYHNLLRIVGIGSDIRFLYAPQLISWLKNYMGLETDEDFDSDDYLEIVDEEEDDEEEDNDDNEEEDNEAGKPFNGLKSV